MRAVDYRSPFVICDEVTGLLTDTGHLLGSAAVSLTIQDNGTKSILRSVATLADPTIKFCARLTPSRRLTTSSANRPTATGCTKPNRT